MLLVGQKVRLRTLLPGDVELIYAWENDSRLWSVSGTTTPFSRETICQFIENQQYDIEHTGQMRFVICRLDDDAPVGMIDLFEFDSVNLRAGVGIAICDPADRQKGYGGEAVELVAEYAELILGLRQIWCSVGTDNLPSRKLFSGREFAECGVQKEWSRHGNEWVDEIVFRRMLSRGDFASY
jgi:diamine N-acetyltransferase